MANNVQNIADIFERKLFRVPDYQRGYSWSDKQREEFYDDLMRIVNNKNHYTGLLTLRKVDIDTDDQFGKWQKDRWLIESGYTPFYIVDGQQRLTTIIILIQSILDGISPTDQLAYNSKQFILEKYIFKKSENYKSYIFGYEYNDPSDLFLRSKIFKDTDSAYEQSMTIYTSNLHDAKKFFDRKLAGYTINELNDLFKKITLKLQFNVYLIEEELDEFIVFETTNNRGKPLSKLELLKNRLIYLTTIMPNINQEYNKLDFEKEKSNTRLLINQAWKDIYEFLGKNRQNVLDDDDFLRTHYYIYYGYKTDTASTVDSILLEEEFTAKRVQQGKLKFKELNRYVTSLKKAAYHWFRVNNPDHIEANLSEKVTFWLSKVNKQKFTAFSTCLLAVFMNDEAETTIIRLLNRMERYYFLVFGLSKRRSNTGSSAFYQRAHYLYTLNISAQELINEIEEKTNSEYGFDKSLKRFKERVVDELFNNQSAKSFGFYGWSEIQYFLHEYELYLQGNSEDRVIWNNKIKSQIDHIIPRNYSEIECWRSQLKNYKTKEKEKIVHNLGNLILLTKKKNSLLQNKCFDVKKNHPLLGLKDDSFSAQEVYENEKWGVEEVVNRSLDLLDFMEDRWKIEIGSVEDKLKLLKLDFTL